MNTQQSRTLYRKLILFVPGFLRVTRFVGGGGGEVGRKVLAVHTCETISDNEMKFVGGSRESKANKFGVV